MDLDITKYGLEEGDVVAFKGKGFFSDAIMKCSDCNVSHVGIVLSIAPNGEPVLIESTTLNKAEPPGVFINPLRKRVDQYNGSIWLLPLAPKMRRVFHTPAFRDACTSMVHDKYDKLGVLDFMVRKWFNMRCNPFPGYVFCSCLVSKALEAADVLPISVYPRNEAPSDVCAFDIYTSNYYQIKGDAGWEDIRNYNSKVAK